MMLPVLIPGSTPHPASPEGRRDGGNHGFHGWDQDAETEVGLLSPLIRVHRCHPRFNSFPKQGAEITTDFTDGTDGTKTPKLKSDCFPAYPCTSVPSVV